jgi:hypothetical protein
MTKDNREAHFNCLLIEALVKSMVIQGITDNEKLVAAVDEQFHPKDEDEMEIYSEAILYAKLGTLN